MMTATGQTTAWPARTEWRMVIALTIIAMLALLDKYALSLLVQPLKWDLGLSDTQVGIAVGAAFAIANTAVGIPAGWAADRYSRRLVVFGGILLWSMMAVACGLAGSFWTFFLARAGVGLGEGLMPPASYSLIRDGVAPERRGRAFGVFAMSNTLGPGIALLLGGTLIGAIVALRWQSLPLVGPVKPWQLTLIVLGLAGLPLAFLAYAFPDPARHGHAERPGSYRDALKVMRRERAIYWPLIIFSCSSAMVASALGIWFPAFVGRAWRLTPQVVGPTLGLILCIAGPLGLFVAGSAIDRYKRSGREGAGRVAVIVAVMLSMFATAVPLAPAIPLMWLVEAGVVLCSTCYLAIVSVVVSQNAPPAMVGKIMAVLLVLQGIFGSGLAPIVVGFLADHVSGGLGQALAMHAGLMTLVGIVAAVALARALGTREEHVS